MGRKVLSVKNLTGQLPILKQPILEARGEEKESTPMAHVLCHCQFAAREEKICSMQGTRERSTGKKSVALESVESVANTHSVPKFLF